MWAADCRPRQWNGPVPWLQGWRFDDRSIAAVATPEGNPTACGGGPAVPWPACRPRSGFVAGVDGHLLDNELTPPPAVDAEEVGMSKNISTKDRKKLGKKSFALPGKRKYPIPDKAHARNALARVAQNGTPAEQKKVKAAVKKRFPSIGKKKKT